MQLGSTLTNRPYGSGVAFKKNRKRLAELRAALRQEVACEILINLRRDICRELRAKLRMVKGEQLDRLLAGYFGRGCLGCFLNALAGAKACKTAWIRWCGG